MPRNASGTFTLDSRYLVAEGDTILPSQHNPVLEDIQTDLNAARPIVAGGTGASSVVSARTNLSVYSKADVDEGFTAKVATKTALKALDTASVKACVLTEATRQKLFMWTTGDFTTQVDGDPGELSYITADGVAASLGCWVAVTGAGASVTPIIQGGTGKTTASEGLTALGGMASATYDPNAVGADAFDMANMVEATDAKIMTAAERTKLSGIETAADVTDATNVASAAASITDASSFGFVLPDDDTLAGASATKLARSKNVKAYADTKVPMLATKTAAAAYAPVLAPDFLRTAGYTSAGDGGAALYKKAASEPSHDGKFSITLSDGTTVVWYELAEIRPTPEMFGAPKDGTNDDAAAINKAIVYANAVNLPEVFLIGDYRLNTSIVPKSGVMIIGGKKARLNSHTTAAYNHSATTLGPLQHAGLQGVSFVHYDDTDANAVAIKLNSCQYCRWSDIYMSGYDAGTAVYINTTLEHTDVPASGIDEPYGAVNFLFNKFDQIVVQACRLGFDFIGGPLGATTFGNVITANEYRGIVLRSVSLYGLNSRQWHDNDRFYDWHITITADGAACVNLGMSASADEYIGVSAHHFYGLTMVRDMTVTWTSCYGIVFRNTPQCLATVASDGEWPVAGQFLYNPYDVEVDIRGSYLHPTYADGSPVSVFENRTGRISQSTLTEQFGNVTVTSGATSYAVTMPAKMFKKPDVVNVMPYSNPGVYWYVDPATISATGFTIKFSAALAADAQFNWEAKVRAVS